MHHQTQQITIHSWKDSDKTLETRYEWPPGHRQVCTKRYQIICYLKRKRRSATYIREYRPGTPAKKRTIPHSPCSPLISKGFPAIKNLGHFDSRQDGILLFKHKSPQSPQIPQIPQSPQKFHKFHKFQIPHLVVYISLAMYVFKII
jgi:hypothetical protein